MHARNDRLAGTARDAIAAGRPSTSRQVIADESPIPGRDAIADGAAAITVRQAVADGAAAITVRQAVADGAAAITVRQAVADGAAAITVRQAVADGAAAIALRHPDTPHLDATLLLAQAFGLERSRLLAMLSDVVPASVLAFYQAYVERRLAGEPLAYIGGWREFYGRRFMVDRRVLVPRPETEHLVEAVLARLPPPGPMCPPGVPADRPIRMTGAPAGRLISVTGAPADRLISVTGAPVGRLIRYHDAFAGSGCVGISVAAERPDVVVSLSDASAEALEVCMVNAVSLTGGALDIRQGWGLTAAQGLFDCISANPPYVASALTDAILAAGGAEPRLALDGGVSGLDCYGPLAAEAIGLLKPGACLVLEIGDDQGPAVRDILMGAGFGHVEILPDLAGRDRVVVGEKGA
jgi:release factor glutamine methyltransferase